ncbi:hypothetical protein EDC04DRAFT_2606966 [Pisolithus marmoratus]|nr:hypothetical protein EDC04DRAFT_2606966 [Pisolithus marmoratus]
MSHFLDWPSLIFFYPLGNTPAICLTEELSPEHKAGVLLLGCGDPRHILYTVHADASTSSGPRKLDFTCCDYEAAILARNTLLFTLLADDNAEDKLSSIWNIFYLMMLDESSLSLLIEQCRKLVSLAESLDSWRQGPYAHIIAMCNSDTLSEIGRFWKLWLMTTNFDAKQAKRFKENFMDDIKSARKRCRDEVMMASLRAAGPLAPVAQFAVSEQFERFWMTGVADNGSPDNPNPTFAFSSFGVEFPMHYGSDPISGFHLAEALTSSGLELSNRAASVIPKVVQAARQQFNTWCKAVIGRVRNSSATSTSLKVRMYAGDALAFCQALHSVNTSVLRTPIFVAPWKLSVVQLDDTLYSPSAPSPAPTSFNVIETSNLLDHLGLHNLLTVTIPLLCGSPSSTLYTETLLSADDSPVPNILDHVCGDLSTVSLLLGHHKLFRGRYHERIAWKRIDSGFPSNTLHEAELSFTAPQLARKLFDIYLRMFCHEDLGKWIAVLFSDMSQIQRKAQASGHVHYTRRSFTLLLAHIRTGVRCDWNRVIDDLESLIMQNRTLITASDFYQEIICQLHLAGFRLPWFSPEGVRALRSQKDPPIFRSWSMDPEVVTVVLMVPRNAIAKVKSDLSSVGNPILQCEIRVDSRCNAFACISASFGKLKVSGNGENKVAVVVEDRAGINGTSPLIVSFPVLSPSLIYAAPGGTVGLTVLSTFASVVLRHKLGPEMCLFKAPLTDERAPTGNDTIHLERSPVPCKLEAKSRGHPIHVEMDKSNTQIQWLTAHVDIDPAGQASLASGCAVTVEQLSLNKAKIHVDQLRVARKSKYVEVVAPMTLTLNVKGESNITENFRATLNYGIPTLWGMHRVNLDRCPAFKLSTSHKAFDWLGPHLRRVFSQRERKSRERNASSGSTIPDTLMNLKDSLHTLFGAAAGLERPAQAEFALWNHEENITYVTIIVTDIRFDIGSHTIVADSWIIPASNDIQDELKSETARVLPINTDARESDAWRHLLPLLIERCRTWKHKPSCEYLVYNSVPLYPGAGSDTKASWCSCGMGIGIETLREHYGSVTAKYATRAAIGPLFPVSYMEKVE